MLLLSLFFMVNIL